MRRRRARSGPRSQRTSSKRPRCSPRFSIACRPLPLSGITEAGEAPLAVVGAAPRSGLFAFDKFSSAPFIMDGIRNDVAANGAGGDSRRRLFLVPRAQVHRLNMSGNAIASIDLSVAGARQPFAIPPGCAVVLANGTIEASRLALESLGVGSQQFGS